MTYVSVPKKRKRFLAREYAAIIARQDGKCFCGCNEDLGTDSRDIEFDHELELAIGGTDTLDNLRALKKKHHLVKTKANAAKIAKAMRLEAKGGHRRRDPNQIERELSKILEGN